MSDLRENGKSDEIDFSWGKKRGRGGQNKEVQFYESFTYDGVEYSLYDSIYLFKDGETKPYIGKLIKIWEHSNKARKVKVLWFFYPWEISNYLSGENVLNNELFLASGVGKGLANINPLEAIAGKCNVVCVSKDERNRQPSIEELKMAHYVFYRTFDVQNHVISDKLDEKIAMIEVNILLNKNDFQSPDSANAVVVFYEPLIPTKDTRTAHDAVERDASMGFLSLKDNPGAKSLSDKSNCHPVVNFDAAGPDNADLVSGMERKLTNNDPGGACKDVVYGGSVGSLVFKDVRGSKGISDVAGPTNLGPVALPATKVALASSQKIIVRSPNTNQSDANQKSVVIPSNIGDSVHSLGEKAANFEQKSDDGGKNRPEDSVPPVTAADNRKFKVVKDNHRPISAVAKSDGGPLKKLKTDSTAPLSSDDGGTSTRRPATAVINKASQGVGAATETNDRGRLTKEFNGVINGLSRKIKSEGLREDKSDNKLLEVSVKQLKVKQESAAINIATNEASQPAADDAETDDIGSLSRKTVCTSNGLPEKLKPNSMVQDKSNDELRKALVKESKAAQVEVYGRLKEVTQRPSDRSKWFTASPWEDRMKEARDQGRLVLLQNLDPAYTSLEIENVVWHGLGENCTAKVVQHTVTSSRHSGQAFAIFKTQEVAERIIQKLEKDCLMLPNGRPIVGSREVVRFPGKHSPFPGHLIIDKLRHQMQRESREAVSTSHSSQTNTVEYEMAIEWRLLQDRSELWWKMLHKKQGEQIKKLKASLKSNKLASL